MGIVDFINFNQQCPVCGEPLTLYMQWANAPCWKATKIEGTTFDNGWYRFDQYCCIDDKYNDQYMDMIINGDDYQFGFSNTGLLHAAKRYRMYLFYMCNEKGFKSTQNGKNYQLLPYYACYYRATSMLELHNEDDGWRFKTINPEHQGLINKHESFTYKQHNDVREKVYILDLDYEDAESTFFHFVITTEQKKNKGPKSQVFEKELPLLTKRPNFQDHQAMMDRFDSWLLMS